MLSITLLFKRLSFDVNSATKLIASIITTENLIPNAFADFVHIPKKMYKHLLSSFSVNSQTEVCNILAFCKNVFNQRLKDCINKTVLVEIAVNVLEKYFTSGIELKMTIIFLVYFSFWWNSQY